MDIKTSFGLKPVKESFSLNEEHSVPIYKRASSYNNYKEMQDVTMKGVTKHSTVIHDKSDYTQRGDK